MALGYSTVRVNVTSLVIDGADSDDLPDTVPLTGTIVFKPMLKPGKAIRYTDDDGIDKLKALTEMEVSLDNLGNINHQNRNYVKVPAPTAATTNMGELQWQAEFIGLKYGDKFVALEPIYFYAVPDAEINLANHVNVAPNSTAVMLTRGPQGFSIGDVTNEAGELVVKLDDPAATEVGRVVLPVAEVDDAAVSAVMVPGTETRALLDETYVTPDTVPPLVAEALAGNGAIIEAAGAAVTANLASRDLVNGTDPRISRILNRAGIAIVETDENGNVSRLVDTAGHTWIKPAANIIDAAALRDFAVTERTLSGPVAARMTNPMDDANIVGGFTDGVRMSELVFDKAGAVPEWAAKRIVERGLSKGALTGALAGPDLMCVGDSLTWHGSSGGTAGWPGIVAANLGVDQYNAGWTGQTASDIAARMGANPIRVTMPDKTLPASGAVTVTLTGTGNPVGGSILVGKTIDGVIVTPRGPIPTTLQRPDTNTVVLTRSVPGAAVVFAADPVWYPMVEPPRSDRIHIFWVGRNGPTQAGNTAALDGMIAQQTAGRKRFLVLEVPPWKDSAEPFADTFNQILCERYPNNYVPIATWLRTAEAATAAGIVFTADDLIDIADGYLPRSFRDDGVHPSTVARTAIAYRLTQEIESRGWV
jgi:hypothetical protein